MPRETWYGEVVGKLAMDPAVGVEFTGDLRVCFSAPVAHPLALRPLPHFGTRYVVHEVLPLHTVSSGRELGSVLQGRIRADEAPDLGVHGPRPVDSASAVRVRLNAISDPFE